MYLFLSVSKDCQLNKLYLLIGSLTVYTWDKFTVRDNGILVKILLTTLKIQV